MIDWLVAFALRKRLVVTMICVFGAIYGYFTQKVAWKRWALIGLSIPIAIVANAFRVAGTGFLAYFIGPEAAQGFYHTFAGWIVFAVAFVLLLGAGGLLAKLSDRPAAASKAVS